MPRHAPTDLLGVIKDDALQGLIVLMLSGEIMVSAMGDAEGKGRGGYVLLDQNFQARCPRLRISGIQLRRQHALCSLTKEL